LLYKYPGELAESDEECNGGDVEDCDGGDGGDDVDGCDGVNGCDCCDVADSGYEV